jgi:hypothetical protein
VRRSEQEKTSRSPPGEKAGPEQVSSLSVISVGVLRPRARTSPRVAPYSSSSHAFHSLYQRRKDLPKTRRAGSQ